MPRSCCAYRIYSGWLLGLATTARCLAAAAAANRRRRSTPSQSAVAGRQRADGERADRERADGERADGERADGERADRERADRERADRERLRDPLAREFLKYVVSCALDDGDSISSRRRHAVQVPGLAGAGARVGRAHGSCDGACQRWVSACVLARVDAAGVKRRSRCAATTPALPPATDTSCATTRSARRRTSATCSSENQPRFLCLSPGKTGDERVCGDSLADCPMTVVGSCDDACARGPYRRLRRLQRPGRAGAGPSTTKASRSFCRSTDDVIGTVVRSRSACRRADFSCWPRPARAAWARSTAPAI